MSALRKLVLLVAALGLAAQLGASALLGDAQAVAAQPALLAGVPPLLLVLGLLLLTVAGDLVYVPVRRG